MAVQSLTLFRTLSETRNDLSQCEQRFVDIDGFLGREARVSGLARPLAAG